MESRVGRQGPSTRARGTRPPDEPVIPDAVMFDRGPVLRRALRGLPSPMLAAMVKGIEREPNDLIAGRLFKSRDRGGCPVGVMLRELFPEAYAPGRLRFWFRDRWIEGIEHDRALAKAYPRLGHLEVVFDKTVRRTRRGRPGLCEAEVARAVGLWFSAEAQAELAERHGQLAERHRPAIRMRRAAGSVDPREPVGEYLAVR